MIKIRKNSNNNYTLTCTKNHRQLGFNLVYSECISCKKCDLWTIVNDINDKEFTAQCVRCGYYLDLGYCVIINNLRKAGLLPDDFAPLCCGCYKIMNDVR